MSIKISYAVTACNEHVELSDLLTFLFANKRSFDEVVVQLDEFNYTQEVIDVVNLFENSKVIYFNLNKDFAAFKNNLKQHCSGDYIFQIDADEIPNQKLISDLPSILVNNINIDLFLVPRVNIVHGLTENHIKKWNWKTNQDGWVNWPDYQLRIFKNNPNIRWQNKVHEIIVGASNAVQLPMEDFYSLMHVKEISRQEAQNKLYENIS